MGRYPVDFTYCSRSALAKAEENKTIRGEAQEVGVRGAVAKSESTETRRRIAKHLQVERASSTTRNCFIIICADDIRCQRLREGTSGVANGEIQLLKTNAFGGDGATARKGIILDEKEYMYLFDIPLLQLANH